MSQITSKPRWSSRAALGMLFLFLPACVHEVAGEEVIELETEAEPTIEEQELTSNVDKALEYGRSLVGTPYGWWYSGPIPQGAPMYARNAPAPAASTVRAQSANCTGLTNLLLRSVGKPIPGAGGTGAYGAYYANVAETFNPNKSYPAGTLLGRYYRDTYDQGHVAVVLANGRVLQSFANYYGGSYPGVNTTYTVAQSHDGGYYEYAVLPQNWLGGTSSGSGSGSGGSTTGFTRIIVDSNNDNNNTSRGYVEASSNWAAGYSDGYYGTGYYWASVNAVSDSVAFHFYLPQASSRTIDAYWVAGANRSSATPFVVINSNGQQVGNVKKDQRVNGSKWQSLGTFSLTKGWNKVLVSRWAADGDVVVADAVRIR